MRKRGRDRKGIGVRENWGGVGGVERTGEGVGGEANWRRG